MRSLTDDMQRFGNLATRSQLRALGHGDHSLRSAVEQERLHRLRKSWLVAPGANADAVRAIALCGRLTATSALASYGVWVSRPSGLWVASPPDSTRLPAVGRNEHRLWVRERFPSRDERRWRMSVADALLHYVCVGPEPDVIASVDSALHQGLVSAPTLDEIFAAAPRRVRRLRRRIRGAAESGLETLMRLACEAQGWHIDVQVYVDGVGRVDLLIDGWLVIELDGDEWHSDAASRDEDSRRDAELIRIGYRFHRFRYRQVMNQLAMCVEVVREMLAGGRPPLPARPVLPLRSAPSVVAVVA
jgi:very-short-patch-repair endonuclease